MKQLLFVAMILMLLASCDNTQKTHYLPESNGQINSLAVVIDNSLWKGAIGDTIRKYFAAPLDGTPTTEPIFSIHQIPPSVFEGNTRNSRNILMIKKDEFNRVAVKDTLFARPQRVAIIHGKTDRDIVCEVQENAAELIVQFKSNEIIEAQKRFQKSLSKSTEVEDLLGIKLTMPSVYKVVKKENNFVWIERPVKGGTANIIIYEMPLNSIPEGDFRSEAIVKMRDSIGEQYIPGRSEGMYMLTEKAFAPSVYDVEIKGRNAIESKGLWEMKNFLLGGPFVNYIIEDKPNHRLLVLEGFVSAPMTEKRDYLFELEAIIKSIEFVKK